MNGTAYCILLEKVQQFECFLSKFSTLVICQCIMDFALGLKGSFVPSSRIEYEHNTNVELLRV